jgi:hypothetical protein
MGDVGYPFDSRSVSRGPGRRWRGLALPPFSPPASEYGKETLRRSYVQMQANCRRLTEQVH